MFKGLGPISPLERYMLLEGEEDGGTESGGAGGTGSGGGNAGGNTGIPQNRVDEIVKGRVAETKKATEERIATELGVPITEAKALIAEARKKADAEKSEAQKEQEAARAEREESAKSKAEAQQERLAARIERTLIRAGLVVTDDEKGDRQLARALRLIDVDSDADADAIKKAVGDLKEDMPSLFGEKESESNTGRRSDPTGKPPGKKATEDAYAKGLERAKTAQSTDTYPILSGS